MSPFHFILLLYTAFRVICRLVLYSKKEEAPKEERNVMFRNTKQIWCTRHRKSEQNEITDIGENVEGYILKNKIRSTINGSVYESFDSITGTDCHLKVTPLVLGPHSIRMKGRLTEARALARIWHENVEHMLYFINLESYAVIVLKIKPNIRSLRQCNQEWTEGRLQKVAKSLIDTLIYVHRQGIIHCNLSMSSVCISGDGEVYIRDFEHCYIVHNDKYDGPRPRCGQMHNSCRSPGFTKDHVMLGMLLFQLFTGSKIRNVSNFKHNEQMLSKINGRNGRRMSEHFINFLSHLMDSDDRASLRFRLSHPWMLRLSFSSF